MSPLKVLIAMKTVQGKYFSNSMYQKGGQKCIHSSPPPPPPLTCHFEHLSIHQAFFSRKAIYSNEGIIYPLMFPLILSSLFWSTSVCLCSVLRCVSVAVSKINYFVISKLVSLLNYPAIDCRFSLLLSKNTNSQLCLHP